MPLLRYVKDNRHGAALKSVCRRSVNPFDDHSIRAKIMKRTGIEMIPIRTGTIVILEDNAARVEAMRASLTKTVPESTPIVVTDSACTMIVWLKNHLADAVLISLDHDLPIRTDANPTDCGDGRMVADYLAQLPPTCPVIVHSSNDACAAGMFYALQSAGWPVSRVVPYDGEAWIGQAWAEQIQKYMRDRWLSP